MSRCDVGLINLERISPGGRFFWLPENLDFHAVNHVMPCMVEMSPNSQEWVKPDLPARSMLWYFFDVKQSFKYFSHLIASGEYPTPQGQLN